MKKLLATLLASTMALTAIGGLVACNDDNGGGGGGYVDPFDSEIGGVWSVPEEDSYWLAGGLAGYENASWDEPAPEGMKFEQNSENENLYRLKLDLFEGDMFKIRFEGLGWDDEAGVSKLTADINLLESLRDGDIGVENGGLGGANFEVKTDGQYEIRINTAPSDRSVVTYVRLGDPTKELDTASYVWYIRGDMNGWDEVTDAEDAPNYVFTKDAAGDSTLEITLEEEQGFKFCVIGKAWGVQLDASKVEGLEPNFENDGGNIKVVEAGTYTFKIDKKGKKVTYTKA
ncbi:MAG: hypothetical protein J1G01_00620 [Clostridiales bacterium]|nr:hypothetical protein [Clostridiales bacterium]